MDQPPAVSTGVAGLDDALRGGLPERRATLLVGGPGTGKSTLAMNFLQAGVDAGERCLYVSTEQTDAELRDSFAEFAIDLDADTLDLLSLHAAPRQKAGREELLLRTLEGTDPIDDKEVPFTGENVLKYLKRAGGETYDRVVVDSVSGLEPASDSTGRFRRTVMDLIRMLDDEFGATSLFVTEERTDGPGADLHYNTHGVIRVWTEPVDGDCHRFLRVRKMRGVDHETRGLLFEIGRDGVRIVRRAKDTSVGATVENHLPTGVPGLDDLLGGGLVNGHATVIEHDGLADRIRIVNAVITAAFERGWAVALVPPTDTHPDQLRRLFADRVGSMDRLLDDDRFFVIDPIGLMDTAHRNVFFVNEKLTEYPTLAGARRHVLSAIRPGSADWRVKEFLAILERIDDRRDDRPLLTITNTQTLTTVLDATQLEQLRHREQVSILAHHDASLLVHNPELLPESAGAFYADNAAQVMRTWLRDGIQYVSLRKGPAGDLDETRFVEPMDEAPSIRVQRRGRRSGSEGAAGTAPEDGETTDHAPPIDGSTDADNVARPADGDPSEARTDGGGGADPSQSVGR